MLAALGIGADAEQVYRFLVTCQSATFDEVLAAASLDSGEARGALAELAGAGLASVRDDGRYVAAPPTVLEGLLARQERALSYAREVMADIASAYRSSREARDAGLFEVVRGADALHQRVVEVQRNAKREVCGVMAPPFIALSPQQAANLEGPMIAKSRLILARPIFDDPDNVDSVLGSMEPGDQVRLGHQAPVRFMIVDAELVQMPLGPDVDSTPVGVTIHAPAVVRAMSAYFEVLWRTAIPLGDRRSELQESPLEAEEQTLAALLVGGLTDDAIANRLGLSRRTAQRRIQDLERKVGARSRMELAWLLGKYNWL